MKSSENSSKNKQKLTIKEGLNDTEIKNDFLKLQKCEKSLISKEEDEEISFWNRISNIVGCSCFKTKK